MSERRRTDNLRDKARGRPETGTHSGQHFGTPEPHDPISDCRDATPRNHTDAASDAPPVGRARKITVATPKSFTKADLAKCFESLSTPAEPKVTALQKSGQTKDRSHAAAPCLTEQFLDGRFRLCVREAVQHVVDRMPGETEVEREQAVANTLGVTREGIKSYRTGLSKMSGGMWSWFLAKFAVELKDFEEPSLDRLSIAGYVEAMAVDQDDRLGPPRKPGEKRLIPLLPKPSELDFVLLKLALGPGGLVPILEDDTPVGLNLPSGAPEAIVRILNKHYQDVLDRADAADIKPDQIAARLDKAFREWGRAYARAATGVVIEWLAEERHGS